MKLSEDQLCEIFADGVRDSSELRFWLLRKTKFARHADECRLLDEEQMSVRPRKRWWRHWWCHVHELAKDRETDIFMVFEVKSPFKRFAFHVENKLANSKFEEGQAEAYKPRGRQMLNQPAYLSHSDFQTVLLAPQNFRDRNTEKADLFDVFIAYEDVAKFLSAYATP